MAKLDAASCCFVLNDQFPLSGRANLRILHLALAVARDVHQDPLDVGGRGLVWGAVGQGTGIGTGDSSE